LDCGAAAKHIEEFFKLRPMNVEVAALCDIDENILNGRVYYLEKTAGKKVRGFTDLRQVLEDKSIDVVSIATPNHWHALSTIWACQAAEATRKYNRIVQHGTQIPD